MKRVGFALHSALASGGPEVGQSIDLMAGSAVGIVALPLSMALAIASGVASQHGLYTAIVGGFVVALLGGSRSLRGDPGPPSPPASARGACCWPRRWRG